MYCVERVGDERETNKFSLLDRQNIIERQIDKRTDIEIRFYCRLKKTHPPPLSLIVIVTFIKKSKMIDYLLVPVLFILPMSQLEICLKLFLFLSDGKINCKLFSAFPY